MELRKYLKSEGSVGLKRLGRCVIGAVLAYWAGVGQGAKNRRHGAPVLMFLTVGRLLEGRTLADAEVGCLRADSSSRPKAVVPVTGAMASTWSCTNASVHCEIGNTVKLRHNARLSSWLIPLCYPVVKCLPGLRSWQFLAQCPRTATALPPIPLIAPVRS